MASALRFGQVEWHHHTGVSPVWPTARSLRWEAWELAIVVKATAWRYVVHNPKILDGEATIRGTRVPVRSIVLLYREYQDIERVQRALPTVSLPAIREALVYYQANANEIDCYIAENEDDDGD
jgi:uncharacterized protein (DUF433 family)